MPDLDTNPDLGPIGPGRDSEKELYDMGYAAGAYVAEACKKSVIKAKKQKAIVELAGRRLDLVLHSKPSLDQRYTTSKKWAEGFFSGFLDKAEEICGSKPST